MNESINYQSLIQNVQSLSQIEIKQLIRDAQNILETQKRQEQEKF
jgi:hypothetical protein